MLRQEVGEAHMGIARLEDMNRDEESAIDVDHVYDFLERNSPTAESERGGGLRLIETDMQILGFQEHIQAAQTQIEFFMMLVEQQNEGLMTMGERVDELAERLAALAGRESVIDTQVQAEPGEGEATSAGQHFREGAGPQDEEEVTHFDAYAEKVVAAVEGLQVQGESPGSEDGEREEAVHLRGGQGNTRDPSIFGTIQSPLPEHTGFADHFIRIFESLHQETVDAYHESPPLAQTYVWMSLATTIQSRNAYIERELEAFKEMCDSMVQDVHWHMGTQVELEEQLEAAEEERDIVRAELEDLKTRWTKMTASVASTPKGSIRGKGATGIDITEEVEYQDADCTTADASTSAAFTWQEQHSYPPAQSENSNWIQPKANNVVAISFEFFPTRSMIISPDTGTPQILQFPNATTLSQIYNLLQYRKMYGLENNPYCVRICEILEIREEMGVQLPDVFDDEQTIIGIPDLPEPSSVDSNVKIAAWGTSFPDTEAPKIPDQGTDTNGIPNTTSNTPPESSSIGNDSGLGLLHNMDDLLGELNSLADSISDTSSAKFCMSDTCTWDEGEIYFNIRDLREAPMVSVRGGGGTPRCSLIEEADEYRDLERSRTSSYRLGQRQFTEAVEVVGVSPNLSQVSHTPVQHDQLETVASSLDEPTEDKGTKGQNSSFSRNNQDCCRHPRGRGCEDWASRLDQYRENCTFCHTEFIKDGQNTLSTSSSVESIGHEDEAPLPMTTPRQSLSRSSTNIWESARSRTSEHANKYPFPIVKDPDLCMRGGAAFGDRFEYDDCRPEWDKLASRTHCSGCQTRNFRNLRTLPTKEDTNGSSPIIRQTEPHSRPLAHDFYGIGQSDSLIYDIWREEPKTHEDEQYPSGYSTLSILGKFSPYLI